jgi:hypothetical protein
MTHSPRRIHVLTAGFSSPNGRAFLMPLILHRHSLLDGGFDVRIADAIDGRIADCDVLIVDGRYFSAGWANESDAVLEEISRLRRQVRHLIYVSIADSAGWDHARPLPYVSLYCKPQLYRDRSVYLRPLYGYRAYSDYYHQAHGVVDEQAVYSEPVRDSALLTRLAVSWNSGLADYSWLGPLRMKAYQSLPVKSLLRLPDEFHAASAIRDKEVSCRIGTKYLRASVAFQRVRISAILADRIDTNKVSRRSYLNELRVSKLAISPFGLGEITLRDFEIFMAGSVLVKPEMAEIETWPDIFQDGTTFAAHRWDLSDLDQTIDALLADPERALAIADNGQAFYRRHLVGPDAGEIFSKHFAGMISKCESADA